MNILEVQDLCKTYGRGEAAVQALLHATFSVRKGEFIAIIGESGSGKSTLLNVVGALDKATSGKVWIDGQDIFSMPEKKLTVFRRQHIGFIFQSFNLIPELNVEQNITFPLLLDYKRPDQRFVNELLNVLGLTERRHHLPVSSPVASNSVSLSAGLWLHDLHWFWRTSRPEIWTVKIVRKSWLSCKPCRPSTSKPF